MENIASFRINHLLLEPGIYVSRTDKDPDTGAIVTTFDLRMTAPNREPVMDTGTMHALEHLAATFLRNDETWGPRIVYFGPMGCRTGCYLAMFGELTSEDIVDLITRCFEWVAAFEGKIPGASPKECGNYADSNLEGAHKYAKRYVEKTLRTIDAAHMTYPV